MPPARIIASADLVERRTAIRAAVEAGYWRTDPPAQEVQIGGIRCLRYTAAAAPRGTIIHLHGGAFRMGCPEQVGPFAAALADKARVDIICPAYRLAPEHPFPAGLNDVFAVLAEIATGPLPIAISGDSAGGGLAAGLAGMAHAHQLPLVGLVLLSPWLDLTATNAAYRAHACSDTLFSHNSATEAAALYLQGTSPHDPAASPLFGDVTGYPPTYLNVGSGEVLSGDAHALVRKLQAANVPVTFHQVDGMEHVAVTRGRDLPGSVETFAGITQFIDDIFPDSQ